MTQAELLDHLENMSQRDELANSICQEAIREIYYLQAEINRLKAIYVGPPSKPLEAWIDFRKP